jgi:hypothetical protein
MLNVSSARTRYKRHLGTGCIWPNGVEIRYGISSGTRRRWEKIGVLPPRDVHIGGRPAGWKPSTLDLADAGGKAQVA